MNAKKRKKYDNSHNRILDATSPLVILWAEANKAGKTQARFQ